MYLSPPNSCSNKTSQNRVFSSLPDPAICPLLQTTELVSLELLPNGSNAFSLIRIGEESV